MTKNLKQDKDKLSSFGPGSVALAVFAGFVIKAIYDMLCAKDLVLNLSKATALISNENIVDAISFANQVGRLDLVSLLLALLGIILGFGAIAGFMHIKETSEAIAEREAKKWLSKKEVKAIFHEWITDNKEDFERMIKSVVQDKIEEMGEKNSPSTNPTTNDIELAKMPQKED